MSLMSLIQTAVDAVAPWMPLAALAWGIALTATVRVLGRRGED